MFDSKEGRYIDPFHHSRVVTGPGGVAFDPVTGARRRRWVFTWLLSWQSWNGIHSQLFCPGQGYRQCPPPPYSMTRWSKKSAPKNIQIPLNKDSPSSIFWQYFRCPINFYIAGGGTEEQQKHDTPSKFWQYGGLWLRRRRGEAKRPKEESQPATYEAKTNRPPECQDND